jgi:hypothetical protein
MKPKWFLAVGTGLVLFLVIQGATLQAQKTGKPLSLIYSNSINGEIDPCPT